MKIAIIVVVVFVVAFAIVAWAGMQYFKCPSCKSPKTKNFGREGNTYYMRCEECDHRFDK